MVRLILCMSLLLFRVKIFLLIVFFSSTSYASDCSKNDIHLSKSHIHIGDFFSGKTIDLYGIICTGKDYTVITYLPNERFMVKKKYKNRLGMVVSSSEKTEIESFGYYAREGKRLPKDFRVYDTDFGYAMQKYLAENGIGYIKDELKLNISRSGIIGHKVHFPKSEKFGTYINEFFVFDQDRTLISVHINPILIHSNGIGGTIRDLFFKNRSLYAFICISVVILLSCIVVFLMDLINLVLKGK